MVTLWVSRLEHARESISAFLKLSYCSQGVSKEFCYIFKKPAVLWSAVYANKHGGKPYNRDKIVGYSRIWKQKTFTIQKGFIPAIYIVQSKHVLELTKWDFVVYHRPPLHHVSFLESLVMHRRKTRGSGDDNAPCPLFDKVEQPFELKLLSFSRHHFWAKRIEFERSTSPS